MEIPAGFNHSGHHDHVEPRQMSRHRGSSRLGRMIQHYNVCPDIHSKHREYSSLHFGPIRSEKMNFFFLLSSSYGKVTLFF
jgi:hypothetical protein